MIVVHCPALFYLDMDIKPGQIDKQKKSGQYPCFEAFYFYLLDYYSIENLVLDWYSMH